MVDNINTEVYKEERKGQLKQVFNEIYWCSARGAMCKQGTGDIRITLGKFSTGRKNK